MHTLACIYVMVPHERYTIKAQNRLSNPLILLQSFTVTVVVARMVMCVQDFLYCKFLKQTLALQSLNHTLCQSTTLQPLLNLVRGLEPNQSLNATEFVQRVLPKSLPLQVVACTMDRFYELLPAFQSPVKILLAGTFEQILLASSLANNYLL